MAQLDSDANALAHDLAERFDDLAKRDSSLRTRSNCIGECCTFQLHSNDAKRVAEQTFRRLAREAAEVLGLQQDPRGPEVTWLRLLFESEGVARTKDVVPVTRRRGGVDEDAVARFREIDNAAEASALVLRRIARDGINSAARASAIDHNPQHRTTAKEATITVTAAANRLLDQTRRKHIYKDLRSATSAVSAEAKRGHIRSTEVNGKTLLIQSSFEYWLQRKLEAVSGGRKLRWAKHETSNAGSALVVPGTLRGAAR